jgi:hypothetical protein
MKHNKIRNVRTSPKSETLISAKSIALTHKYMTTHFLGFAQTLQ